MQELTDLIVAPHFWSQTYYHFSSKDAGQIVFLSSSGGSQHSVSLGEAGGLRLGFSSILDVLADHNFGYNTGYIITKLLN